MGRTLGVLGLTSLLVAPLIACSAEQPLEFGSDDPGGHEIAEHAASEVGSAEDAAIQRVLGDVRAQFGAAHLAPLLDANTTLGSDWISEVTLPQHADGAWVLNDVKSGLSLRVQAQGAAHATGQRNEQYGVYAEAFGAKTQVIARRVSAGFEDWVKFEERPAQEQLRYTVQLPSADTRLRLVGNSLELLDEEGTPRLRMAPPFVVDAAREVHPATTQVIGCEVDTDPSAPWGRETVAAGSDVCTVVVSWASSLLYPILVDPSWTTTGSLAQARQGYTLTLLSNGKALAAGGGYGDGDSSTSSAELYDPSTATWATTGSLSAGARLAHSAIRLDDGKVLVVGGYVGGGASSKSAELYNPSTGTWSSTTQLGKERSGAGIAKLANGRVLVVGGVGNATSGTSGEIYNPSNATWAATSALGASHSFATLTTLSDGKVLVVGGAQSEIYNPSTSAFGTLRSQVVSRSNHAAARLTDGRVLVAGGSSARAEVYDTATNAWTEVGSARYARQNESLVLLDDGSVLLTGVEPELFRSENGGVWGPTVTSSSPLTGGEAVKLSNGKVLLAGGSLVGGLPSAQARLYEHTAIPISDAEYRFPPFQAGFPQEVELWARVYRPQTLVANKTYPVVFIIHGRHPTCGHGSNPRIDDNDDYVATGTCPSGYQVVKNHEGYRYIADELARREYIVVSINWNRLGYKVLDADGDTTSEVVSLLNYHIGSLKRWHAGTEATPSSLGVNLTGKLDLNNLAVIGHSRGAYAALYNLPSQLPSGTKLRSVFAIGTARPETPLGTILPRNFKLVQLVPKCDLGGGYYIEAFDNAFNTVETEPGFKATFAVTGVNHNFYNTEWQQPESTLPCEDGVFSTSALGSVVQRQTAVHAGLALILGTTGAAADPAQAKLFDPRFSTGLNYPKVDLGYLPAAHASYTRVLEDFDEATGTNSSGNANSTSNVTVAHNGLGATSLINGHGEDFRYGRFEWTSGGTNRYYQANIAPSGSGVNLSSFTHLDLRVDRDYSTLNTSASTSFKVRLVGPSGTTSTTQTVTATGPTNVATTIRRAHFSTRRLPLSGFSGVALSSVRGIRIEFSGTSAGAIFVANVRASKDP